MLQMLLLPRGHSFKTEKPYVPEVASDVDLRVAAVALGWALGFGSFTTWHAMKQSRRLTTYAVLCWTEILVCLIFSIICYLYLIEVIEHSFAFYFAILTCWAIQVQLLLQIICNRICILISNPVNRWRLKYGVAGLILLVNVSVYCLWIPARLQISERYIRLNAVWDRCEKVIYLLVDAALNFLFVRMVSTRLIDLGLTKYDSLLRFNIRIIAVSLSMDLLIIGLMSLPNSFVYMQFHPVAYIVKLEIEMAMSSIMVKVASASTGIEDNAGETAADAVESKYERRTGPVRVKIIQTVEEEVDHAYPATLREGRGANRYDDDDDDDDDDKRRAFGDDESAYPSTLSKYATFFPPKRTANDEESQQQPQRNRPTSGILSATIMPSRSSNRSAPTDPFKSTDTLEMTHRATSVSSKGNINTDSDDE